MVFLISVKDAKNQGYLIEKQISSTNAVNTLKIFSSLKEQFVFANFDGVGS